MPKETIFPLAEQIKQNVEGRFWKGHDLRLAREMLIPPGETAIPLIVPPDALPSFTNIPQPLDILKRTLVTGRSRYAQLGLFPDPQLATHIALNIPMETDIQNGYFKEPLEARVVFNNLGARPIQLDKDAKICRLFSNEASEHIGGHELITAIAEGEISISGVYGDDWKWMYKNGRKTDSKITGVALRIDPESMRWIPPSADNSPIHISDTTRNFRQEIDEYLEPLPQKTDHHILIIGETASIVSLSPSVHGVLDRRVISRTPTRGTVYPSPSEPTQEQSILAEGYRTNWKIRTETMSLVDPFHLADYVIMRFWWDKPAKTS